MFYPEYSLMLKLERVCFQPTVPSYRKFKKIIRKISMHAAHVNQRVSPTRRHCFLSPRSGEPLLTLFPRHTLRVRCFECK